MTTESTIFMIRNRRISLELLEDWHQRQLIEMEDVVEISENSNGPFVGYTLKTLIKLYGAEFPFRRQPRVQWDPKTSSYSSDSSCSSEDEHDRKEQNSHAPEDSPTSTATVPPKKVGGRFPMPKKKGQEEPAALPSTLASAKTGAKPEGLPAAQQPVQPSDKSSSKPGAQPTVKLSPQPTVKEAVKPGAKPSAQPRNEPKVKLSAKQSVQLEVKPLDRPIVKGGTQLPSAPSAQPADKTVVKPGNKPAVKSSVKPSAQPTAKTAVKPGTKPDAQPSTKTAVKPRVPMLSPPPSTAKLSGQADFVVFFRCAKHLLTKEVRKIMAEKTVDAICSYCEKKNVFKTEMEVFDHINLQKHKEKMKFQASAEDLTYWKTKLELYHNIAQNDATKSSESINYPSASHAKIVNEKMVNNLVNIVKQYSSEDAHSSANPGAQPAVERPVQPTAKTAVKPGTKPDAQPSAKTAVKPRVPMLSPPPSNEKLAGQTEFVVFFRFMKLLRKKERQTVRKMMAEKTVDAICSYCGKKYVFKTELNVFDHINLQKHKEKMKFQASAEDLTYWKTKLELYRNIAQNDATKSSDSINYPTTSHAKIVDEKMANNLVNIVKQYSSEDAQSSANPGAQPVVERPAQPTAKTAVKPGTKPDAQPSTQSPVKPRIPMHSIAPSDEKLAVPNDPRVPLLDPPCLNSQIADAHLFDKMMNKAREAFAEDGKAAEDQVKRKFVAWKCSFCSNESRTVTLTTELMAFVHITCKRHCEKIRNRSSVEDLQFWDDWVIKLKAAVKIDKAIKKEEQRTAKTNVPRVPLLDVLRLDQPRFSNAKYRTLYYDIRNEMLMNPEKYQFKQKMVCQCFHCPNLPKFANVGEVMKHVFDGSHIKHISLLGCQEDFDYWTSLMRNSNVIVASAAPAPARVSTPAPARATAPPTTPKVNAVLPKIRAPALEICDLPLFKLQMTYDFIYDPYISDTYINNTKPSLNRLLRVTSKIQPQNRDFRLNKIHFNVPTKCGFCNLEMTNFKTWQVMEHAFTVRHLQKIIRCKKAYLCDYDEWMDYCDELPNDSVTYVRLEVEEERVPVYQDTPFTKFTNDEKEMISKFNGPLTKAEQMKLLILHSACTACNKWTLDPVDIIKHQLSDEHILKEKLHYGYVSKTQIDKFLNTIGNKQEIIRNKQEIIGIKKEIIRKEQEIIGNKQERYCTIL